eukprot:8637-Eustigmatos_ZCMA.PRE.1
MPSRGTKPSFTVATSLTCTGTPLFCVRTTFSMSLRLLTRPTPRMLIDCCPKFSVRPPTLILALPSAVIICDRVT